MSISDTFYLLIIFLASLSFLAVAYSLPIAKGRSNQRRVFVTRQVPLATLICTIATLAAFGYSFVIASAEANSISVDELRMRSNAVFSSKSSVAYSFADAILSALSARDNGAEIDCRQLTLLPDGNWNLVGSMKIGGATFTDISNIGENFAVVNGMNVKRVIDEKCRASMAAITPAKSATPAH